MASPAVPRLPGITKKHRFTRRTVRKVISLAGAVIIFATFVAKDMRRDKLKDLIDSIEYAENGYLLRMGQRQTYSEILRIENAFAEFRKHPTSPFVAPVGREDVFSPSVKGPSDSEVSEGGKIDYAQKRNLRVEETSNDELLDNLIGLANRLPEAGEHRKNLADLDQDRHQYYEQSYAWEFELSRQELEPILQSKGGNLALNDEIYLVLAHQEQITEKLYGIATAILPEAAKERQKAEHAYEKWTRFTYILYGVGFILGMIGILMGDEENSAIENIKGEIA
jgi:hypothetical protein